MTDITGKISALHKGIPGKPKIHKHGKSGTKIYWVWDAMIRRCLDPKNHDYACYGGRGIKVCERWLLLPNFIADMGEPPQGLTLDRIDNDGPYCKENCRWATRKEQSNNMRKSIKLSRNGVVKTLGEWSEEIGIKPHALYFRYRRHGESDRIFLPHYEFRYGNGSKWQQTVENGWPTPKRTA